MKNELEEGDIVEYEFGQRTYRGIYLRTEKRGQFGRHCAIVDVPEKGIVPVHLDKVRKVA